MRVMPRPRAARASNAEAKISEQPSGGSRKRDASLAAVGDPGFEVETRAQRASRRQGADHDEALRVAETLNDLEAALKLKLSADTRAGMRALVATVLGGGDDAQTALVRLLQEGVRVVRERLTRVQEDLTRMQDEQKDLTLMKDEEIQRLKNQVKKCESDLEASGVNVVYEKVFYRFHRCLDF